MKNLFSKLMLFCISSNYRFITLARMGVFNSMDDKTYIKRMYRALIGSDLHLENPVTFNEKINWLKLYNQCPEYKIMVDKYRVREYIKQRIGEEYLIPLIGVWDSIEEIDIKSLPKQFVLKANHDSGGICICHDKEKFDFKKNFAKLNKTLKKDFFYYTREWPYKDMPRKIIAEKLIVDESCTELKDYKFFCFHGVVKFFKIDYNRFIDHHANYYDREAQLLPFGEECCPPNFKQNFTKPLNFDKMIDIAERLSKDMPFVRIDLYNVQGKIFFGEITFFPASGWGKFVPNEWDGKIGSLLQISGINSYK